MNGTMDQERDAGPVNDISNDQRDLIASTMVLCGVATDPGHMAIMTGTFYNQVVGGLVSKYGYSLRGLDPDIFELINNDIVIDEYAVARYRETGELVPEINIPFTIQYAIRYLQMSQWHWGTAVPLLQRAQSQLINICNAEKILDYRVAYMSIVDEIKRQREIAATEEEEPEERPYRV